MSVVVCVAIIFSTKEWTISNSPGWEVVPYLRHCLAAIPNSVFLSQISEGEHKTTANKFLVRNENFLFFFFDEKVSQFV